MDARLQNHLARMPGHWLPASNEQKGIRPGGIELTKKMLKHLHINEEDEVASFSPELGTTTKIVFQYRPKKYIAIEQNETAAKEAQKFLPRNNSVCLIGSADQAPLDNETINVFYSEAMLTMQPLKQKEAIIKEAWRILKTGGRYGIHEFCLVPNQLEKQHHCINEKPLTAIEWIRLFENNRFYIETVEIVPIPAFNSNSTIQHNRLFKKVKNFVSNVSDRKQMLKIRHPFQNKDLHVSAISMVMRKK
ncbi:class I SAM-dependent methyltransferase [Bacillus chungangensis]|uniref:SAM-dependent methyltransferase n=1 Tax=Bacillus chungangensis TaxID=587633 RepID=A0ABT9WV91_9BACI|nr:class I SAM-dependent methyltransferase [Bacillus chungangensis]MDQ0177221.1 SAM-dependent methyltransferase [Bacillus chungangensis]